MIAIAGEFPDGERSRDVERKRKQRAAAKTVIVPACEDRSRRERLEQCDEDWLRYYCHELFWYDFTEQQLAMISAIRDAILYGGDQALAASRGEGKTKLFERLLLKYVLSGAIKFAVLFGATATHAQDSLQSMRDEIEHNERLGADYPEACVPVQALEDTPNRAHYQLVTGHRHDNGDAYEGVSSRFTWCGHEIIFPNVPGSPAAWGVIATRGLDGAVRGLNKKNRRPEVVGIDDPDTEDTVNSEEQARKLEKRIDRGIAGLGGQQRGVARVMLTTLQRRECVSAWYTDPSIKPSMRGRRFRFLIQKPDRMDLWDEYVEMRKADQQRKDEAGNFIDPNARRSHGWYLTNRTTMDAGAIVANEHRFNNQELPDGSQLEVSALQRYFNEVARTSPEAVQTEYDNDPPEESGPQDSGITAALVRSRLNLLDHRAIPADCIALTAGIDLGKRACHWVVIAWLPGCAGVIVDFGVQDVINPGKEQSGAPSGDTERAVVAALMQWRDERAGSPYLKPDGEIVPLSCVLLDSGWSEQAAYHFIRSVGGKPYFPSKGRAGGNYHPPAPGIGIKLGEHWYQRRQKEASDMWLYAPDVDYWKGWVHERFLTPALTDDRRPRHGSLSLWGKSEKDHQNIVPFSKHITAEVFREEFKEGKGLKRGWHVLSENNHWFDATVLACVGGSVCGVSLLQRPTNGSARSLREMREAAQAKGVA